MKSSVCGRGEGKWAGERKCELALYLACFIYLFAVGRVLNEPCKASLPVMLERKAKDRSPCCTSRVMCTSQSTSPGISLVRCYTSTLHAASYFACVSLRAGKASWLRCFGATRQEAKSGHSRPMGRAVLHPHWCCCIGFLW